MAKNNEASRAGTVPENNSQAGDEETIIKKLRTIAEKYKDYENVPDCIAELVEEKKMNYLVLDLYDFGEGYQLSVYESKKEKEIVFGKYSYGVPLLDSISNGEIPYEIFDKLLEHHLIYDGHLVVKMLICIGKKCKRVHFALLRPSVKTIFAESEINLKGTTSTKLQIEEEKARLIAKYSPDLCLIPDPRVSDIAMSYPQFPFISPRIKSILERLKIHKENAIRITVETGEPCTSSKLDDVFKSYNPKEDAMNEFLLKHSEFKELSVEERDFEDWKSKHVEPNLASYLKKRKIHLPHKSDLNGSYVEIEVFMFEYGTFNDNEEIVEMCDKLCVSVWNCKELYYCSYDLDQKAPDWTAKEWFEVGDRNALDLFVKCFAMLKRKNCVEKMKITREQKLKPKTDVVLSYPPSNHEAEKISSEDEKMSSGENSKTGSPVSPVDEHSCVSSADSVEF